MTTEGLPPDIVEHLSQTFQFAGDGTEGRVDEDEQILGSYVTRGLIIATLDEHYGIVQIRTDIGDVITATINEFYAPLPHIGASMLVIKTANNYATARPAYPVLPPTFTATITSGQNGDTDGLHTAAARHPYNEIGARIAVIGVFGFELNEDDVVLCQLSYTGGRATAETIPLLPKIYATHKIGSVA